MIINWKRDVINNYRRSLVYHYGYNIIIVYKTDSETERVMLNIINCSHNASILHDEIIIMSL